MEIMTCSKEDLPTILALYEMARNYQRIKGAVVWPLFEETVINEDIAAGRQWKIRLQNRTGCVWTVTPSDPLIWKGSDNEAAIYLHRIASHQDCRGLHLVKEIVNWARHYAASLDKKFIRMDTVGFNQGLIQYYQQCGFEWLGMTHIPKQDALPAHYHNASVSLFQIQL